MTDDKTQRDLGRVEGKLDALIKAVEQQGEQSSASRKALYERVGRIETSIEISGEIDAQVRERLDGLDNRITREVMPTVNEVKRWKVAGVTALAIVGMGSAAVGAFLMWAWDVIVSRWHGGP